MVALFQRLQSFAEIPLEKIMYQVNMLQPVFIVGSSKSGTTFLQALFDSHPNIVNLRETGVYYFDQINKGRDDILDLIESFFEGHIDGISNGLEIEEFLALANKNISLLEVLGVRKYLLDILLELASNKTQMDGQKVTHFIEKTPRHFNYIDKIVSDFPSAKIIHLIRDPRDNYLSLKRRVLDSTNAHHNNAYSHATHFLNKDIVSNLECACDLSSRLDKERYRVLFYEDLICDGERVMRDICNWLQLSWNNSLMIPSRANVPWKGNSFAVDLKNNLEPFDTRPIGRWKGELNKREVQLLNSIVQLYNLEEKYHFSKGTNLYKVFVALMFPFEREIPLEAKRATSAYLNSKKLRVYYWVFRDYIRRRSVLLSKLKHRYRNGSTKVESYF
jgi:hypothetical protein